MTNTSQLKEKRTLEINCLSDDMLQCAIEKGFRIPVVSISHYYGKQAKFIEEYNKTGVISGYVLEVYNKNNKIVAIYLMEAN